MCCVILCLLCLNVLCLFRTFAFVLFIDCIIGIHAGTLTGKVSLKGTDGIEDGESQSNSGCQIM